MLLDIKQKDTICALASAKGYCAISIIRVCGDKVVDIIKQLFSKPFLLTPLKANHNYIIDAKAQVIDEVVAIYYPAHKSFVGHDTLEINCHGNPLIVDEILQRLQQCGARLANPGEFTLRAMLQGKIDLVQAENIANLIHAKSEIAKKIALQGLSGNLSKKCEPIRNTFIEVLAHLEARMDFVDEDLGDYERSSLIKKLHNAALVIESMLKNAKNTLKLYEGARIVICGEPNAGKSSLLNYLAQEEKAIVHEHAGTTRDVIEASLNIDGFLVTIVDIAGIRDLHQAEIVEQIGINKALSELKKADIVIWLSDANLKNSFNNIIINNELKDINIPIIKVLNKIEVTSDYDKNYTGISAKTGKNIDLLLNKIKNLLHHENISDEEILITKERQINELRSALNFLNSAITLLSNQVIDEIICFEIRSSAECFDRLLGKSINNDILDKIFSEFCIGK